MKQNKTRLVLKKDEESEDERLHEHKKEEEAEENAPLMDLPGGNKRVENLNDAVKSGKNELVA
ncbi:hypothetical protein OS493_023097 [Desmophyllum pertusum]|uniref:Uncharacterized protein n=1 Tax=Desmophyllum pertusum TaxID=174260 RepID=A0A9X0CSE8_9CNID|nr:hypothetical protein OS493_023097 [Desmophyllum pertusum]